MQIRPTASQSRHFTQCDSLIIGKKAKANTHPYMEVQNGSAQVEHEASTSKIDELQMLYCMQRGLRPDEALPMIVNGFCKEVFQKLPMEFAAEVQQLLEISLEGSVG